MVQAAWPRPSEATQLAIEESAGPQPIPREEWEAHVAYVTREMKEHTKAFITPISRALTDMDGVLEGTGNYVTLGDSRYLLTNEHVAGALKEHPLGHQFLGTENVFRVRNPFTAIDWPTDAAMSKIEPATWEHDAHESRAIGEERWAVKHAPVQGEILFLTGYSDQRSKPFTGMLFTAATPYSAQEKELPKDGKVNPVYHFALDYRPDRAMEAEPGGRSLPIPKGFSGAIVWNTRFVELAQNGETWSPECARVTGLVWYWLSSEACIVATRAEYVMKFLKREAF